MNVLFYIEQLMERCDGCDIITSLIERIIGELLC